MSGPTKLLYLLLVAAADRQGLSFYSDARIEQVLALCDGELALARAELAELDLLAFDGRIYQLLSLAHHPPWPAGPVQPRTATRRQCEPPSVESTASSSDPMPEDVQAILHKLLG